MSLNTRHARRRQSQATDIRPLLRQLARPLTAPFILLLSALLRFYRLSGQSLWADEGNSVALAKRGFVEIAQRTAFDIHPPLYYWLLKIWIFIFGDSEIGLRSLSVILGIVLVFLIGVLGTRLFSSRIGLMAAFIAALSPLQVYYSQEARMYMLLTLLGTLTVLAACSIWQSYSSGTRQSTRLRLIYILTVAAGLYTHYAYPLILLAVNLAALLWFWQTWRSKIPAQRPATNDQLLIRNPQHLHFAQAQVSAIRNPSSWFLLQIIPILLYLPWLPIAWRQITTWPSENQSVSLLNSLNEISTTLFFGLSWPFETGLITTAGLGIVLLVPLWLGIDRTLRFRFYGSRLTLLLLWLWFVLPVLLTIIIFSPAFLKFLLAATPPLALLLALIIDSVAVKLRKPGSDSSDENRLMKKAIRLPKAGWLSYLLGGGLLATLLSTSAISLYFYHTDATYARDNYRGIANFIKALSGPNDAVILNAEGQQDVFGYYYYERGLISKAPVYPLPQRRPLDEAATLMELEQITAKAKAVYAVYWATAQADPNGVIEGWLDHHLTKATDRWYGNVRLVSYANPRVFPEIELAPVNYRLGQNIRLTGYALSTTQMSSGDILQLDLTWETDQPLTNDLTVFAQMLDSANHVVGQRDARPLTPTSHWPAGQVVTDSHGIFVEPGTPPGPHRLIVGLYDSATGQRLPVTSEGGDQSGDFIELATVEIVRPATPLPLEAFEMQVRLNRPMVDVVLLGYDLYKTGYRSMPTTPLHPGDPLHLVVYWTPRWPVQWLEDQLFIQVVTNNGRSSPLFVTRRPSGTDYSIKDWQPGEIIRAQYDLFLTNVEPGTYRLTLDLGVTKFSSQRVVAITEPFRVE